MPSRRRTRLLALALRGGLCTALLALLLLPASPAAAKNREEPYALIFGTVWTADSRPAYGVKVKIRRADQSKPKWEAVSDHHGEFAVRVPAGSADYVLQADVKGPKNTPKPETKVHVINDERVDVSLHLTE
ncbi:MAG: hypothetical protein M3P27_00195 [Acidobacteriota bacterium]|nr:hypothetical protein [Acidobacteriota bacterium]